jgi:hypothetical protein
VKSVIRHAGVPTIAQFAGAPGPAIVIDIDTSGANPIVTFRDLGDTADRVTATMTGSERTTVVTDV